MLRQVVQQVQRYLSQRGFNIQEIRQDLLCAEQGKLKVSVWLSDKDYLEWYDPLNLIDEFNLHDCNALIVIAPRAYTIADEVLHSIERAKYWYDLFIDVRVYSVDVAVLEKALEESVNSILTNYIDLVSNMVSTEGYCPRCRRELFLLYLNKFQSLVFKKSVIERIYKCLSCGLKIHRLDIDSDRR